MSAEVAYYSLRVSGQAGSTGKCSDLQTSAVGIADIGGPCAR